MSLYKLIPVAVLLLGGSANIAAEDAPSKWKPYICRAVDWAACEQGKRRIYPSEDVYDSQAACYEKFEVIFETDPVISKKYPQTEKLDNSHVFDCEEIVADKKAI